MTLMRRFILAAVLIAGFAPAMAQVPAAVPALPDTERRTSYSISGTTCACAVNFALYGDSTDYQNWVEVFINGVRYDFNDATHGWTITSPSGSLATLARPITNAVLTFNAVQIGTVQIVGARRPRRASQFNENAGVSARNFNQVLTDIISQNREIWDKTNDMTGRGIFAPPGETLNLLAAASTRANSTLGFDALGQIKYYTPASGVTSAASVGFVQNGTGAVATTIDALYRGIVVTPEMFGAQCSLSFDSAPAIQRAINYLSTAQAGTVEFSKCLYFINSPINISTKGISLVGRGAATGNGTELYFVPSNTNQCAVSLSAGAGILSDTQIRNLSIRTPDTTTYKTAICASDSSVVTIRDVFVYGFNGGTATAITGAASSGAANEIRLTVANASVNYNTGWAVAVSGVVGTTEANFGWPITVVDPTHIDLKGSTFTNAYVSGGTITLASTGLQTKGREFVSLENVSLNADMPLRISVNPNLSTSALDQSNFSNLSLISTITSCNIMVDDGGVLSSTKWTGSQSWGGGKSAFCWRDKSGPAISEQISFDNVRSEQKSVAGGWYFDIQPNATTYSFRINNLLAADRNGVRARNVANLQIDNPHFVDNTVSCLDIDATVQNTQINNGYFIAGGSATLTGQTLVMSGGKNPSTGCLPPFAVYANAAVGAQLGTPAAITLTNGTGLPTTGLTGSLQAAQEPAHTGDVTNTAGSLAMTVARVNGVDPTKAASILTGTSGSVAATDGATIFNPSGTFTATLPTASAGRLLYVKTVAAQAVNSASSNIVPIGGGAAGAGILTATAGKWAILQADGANWIIMANN